MSSGIPPYISFRTFENFLAELRARGVPSRIDRSILSHKSGTVQSQLLLTLRYLGLLTASGRPTEELHTLIKTQGQASRRLLQQIVESSYGFLFNSSFDLKLATSQEAEEVFERTGASGETVRRCLAFFIALAKKAGIPFSPYIKPHKGKKSVSRSLNATPVSVPESESVGGLRNPSTSKEIRLRSGGSLTLRLTLDVFELDKTDREFVFDLIDQLNKYQVRLSGTEKGR